MKRRATDGALGRMLTRNTLAAWCLHGVAVASALILTPVILDSLGTSVYGAWVLLSQLTGYAGLLDLGLQPALMKYAAAALAKQDDESLGRLLGTALCVQLGISAFVLVVVFATSPFLESWFRLGAANADEARQAYLLFGVGAALGFPASVFSALVKARQRLDLISWVGVASQLIRFVGVLVALGAGAGLVGLAGVTLLSNAGGYLASLALALRDGRLPRARLRNASSAFARKLFAFGIASQLGTMGWYLAHASDAVVIGALLSAEDVAYYGVAVSILALLSGLVSAFSASLLPLASDLEARMEHDEIQRVYLFGTRVTLLIALPVIAVVMLWGPEFIRLWVGSTMSFHASPVLRLLACAHIAIAVNSVGLPMAIGLGMHRAVGLIALSEGLVNLLLSVILASRFGIEGVAFGTLVPAVLVHLVLWPFLLRRHFGLRFGRYVSDGLWPAVVSMLVLLPALWLVYENVSREFPWTRLVIPGLCLLLFWAVSFKKSSLLAVPEGPLTAD